MGQSWVYRISYAIKQSGMGFHMLVNKFAMGESSGIELHANSFYPVSVFSHFLLWQES